MNDKPHSNRTIPFVTGNRHKGDPEALTLFQQSRERWNEEFGGYIHRERQWRKIALALAVITLVAVSGNVYLGLQNKMVPYVVEVDKLGHAQAVQRATIASKPSSAVIRSHLANWILNTRTVYMDTKAQEQAVKEVFASVNKKGPAYNHLLEYYAKNNPLKLGIEETRSIKIESAIPISDKTFRIEWKEERRGQDGKLLNEAQMQAAVTYMVNPPTDEATLLLNPLGIFVDSFDWSERL